MTAPPQARETNKQWTYTNTRLTSPDPEVDATLLPARVMARHIITPHPAEPGRARTWPKPGPMTLHPTLRYLKQLIK